MEIETPGEQVDVPREALVIRFRPTDPDRVLASAEKAYRLIGRYQLSVFAATQRPEETATDLRKRLLQVSELANISPADHPKYYVCSQADELYRRGFTFWKDGDDDERDEHYSVDLGTNATRDDVEKFLGAFGPPEKRDKL